MDGMLSHSMRRSGVDYRVNFGVERFRLVEMAQQLPHSVALSMAFYAENIRELRLLAFLVMPVEAMDEELALHFVSELHYAEEAQMLVFHLLRYCDFASDLAFRLIATDLLLARLTGWLLLGRLFMDGKRLTQRDADEVFDQIEVEFSSAAADIGLRKAVGNALLKLMELGPAEEARGESLLKRLERRASSDSSEAPQKNNEFI